MFCSNHSANFGQPSGIIHRHFKIFTLPSTLMALASILVRQANKTKIYGPMADFERILDGEPRKGKLFNLGTMNGRKASK